VAKGYGAGSPIFLASKYGLLDPKFFNSISPIERVLIDSEILNRLITSENEAQERASKKAKEKREHPGMERDEDPEDFWDAVERANKGLEDGE
jgi:hypothetical protein